MSAKRDENRNVTLQGVSSVNFRTPTDIAVNPVTHALISELSSIEKTIKPASGTVGTSGDNTLMIAGANRTKVFAFSLSTVSTTAVTVIFQSGPSGPELWRVLLQSPASVNTGANLAVSPPSFIFATSPATLLNLNLSASVTINYSIAAFDGV